jgi:FMN-dependent NADH-azoreductase
VIPELTMASHDPALAALLPMHEASMADAHDRARELAATIAHRTPAA